MRRHLCLVYEDGLCKRFLQTFETGWEGDLPNPFDHAFVVPKPNLERKVYTHGVESKPPKPTAPVADKWCPEIIKRMKNSDEISDILRYGCVVSENGKERVHNPCPADMACRCLTDKTDDEIFCQDYPPRQRRCLGSSFVPQSPLKADLDEKGWKYNPKKFDENYDPYNNVHTRDGTPVLNPLPDVPRKKPPLDFSTMIGDGYKKQIGAKMPVITKKGWKTGISMKTP